MQSARVTPGALLRTPLLAASERLQRHVERIQGGLAPHGGFTIGGSPTGQQVHGLLGRRPRLGGVDRQRQTGIGLQLHPRVGQRHLTDDRMPEGLEAESVVPHVVRVPAATELRASRRELPDEFAKLAVVRIPGDLCAQDRHGDVREAVPVRVELLGSVSRKTCRAILGGPSGMSKTSV